MGVGEPGRECGPAEDRRWRKAPGEKGRRRRAGWGEQAERRAGGGEQAEESKIRWGTCWTAME